MGGGPSKSWTGVLESTLQQREPSWMGTGVLESTLQQREPSWMGKGVGERASGQGCRSAPRTDGGPVSWGPGSRRGGGGRAWAVAFTDQTRRRNRPKPGGGAVPNFFRGRRRNRLEPGGGAVPKNFPRNFRSFKFLAVFFRRLAPSPVQDTGLHRTATKPKRAWRRGRAAALSTRVVPCSRPLLSSPALVPCSRPCSCPLLSSATLVPCSRPLLSSPAELNRRPAGGGPAAGRRR